MEDIEKLEDCPFCGYNDAGYHKESCYLYMKHEAEIWKATDGCGGKRHKLGDLDKAWNQRQEPKGWVSVDTPPKSSGDYRVYWKNEFGFEFQKIATYECMDFIFYDEFQRSVEATHWKELGAGPT